MRNQTKQKNKMTSVPHSIELLFNNEKLDIMKILCLMNAFASKNHKPRKVSEIMFYYSLINFDLIQLFNSNEGNMKGSIPSPNMYFRFQTKLNEILLKMVHLQFIEIRGQVVDKIDSMKVELKPTGKEFYEAIDSGFFDVLKNNYIDAINSVKFTVSNQKVIKGVQQ